MKPASQIAPDALGEDRWHQGAGDCEAPSAISNPPRFRGKPISCPLAGVAAAGDDDRAEIDLDGCELAAQAWRVF